MRALILGIIRTALIVVLCASTGPVLVAGTVLASLIFLPLPASLPQPKLAEGGMVSRVYDQNGDEIAQFRRFDQRVPIQQADIPLHLKQALIATEDRNFYNHSGFDVRGTARALKADIEGGEASQGGSTITQQYVKLAYVGKEKTILRKVREAVLASQLDRATDKDVILFNYFSNIFLGSGAYGVGAASETYFRKPVSQLTVSEAALLVGIIPAPTLYEPRNPANRERSEMKRLLVLQQMFEQGYLDPAQYEAAKAETLFVISDPNLPAEPHTFVWPPEPTETAYPYFVDYVRRFLIAKYGEDAVYDGGLRIQTTLDPKIQDLAEKTVTDALRGVNPEIEMALTAVEPPTGYVKAVVGGRDFGAEQVNLGLGKCAAAVYPVSRAGQTTNLPVPEDKILTRASCWDQGATAVQGGGTGRQPGSSWKPFVLAAAFEKGIPPSRVYPAPSTYRIPGTDDVVQNYEGSGGGSATLKVGTQKSYNTLYAQLIRDVGYKETADMAKKLGVDTAWVAPGYPHGVSYSLGAQEVAPLDMASAFGVFAARGLKQETTPILKIQDRNGNVIVDNQNRQPIRVLDEVIADNVNDVLAGVITDGTGTRADIGRPAAGKTGTAQEWRDAWFVGYTPTLSASVWIGYKEAPRSLFNVKGTPRVSGGTIPAATWKAFMQPALAGVPVTEFHQPAPIKVIRDQLNKPAPRTGVEAGGERKPAGTPAGGPYEVGNPARPPVEAPTTTTTSTIPPPTTTTTTTTPRPTTTTAATTTTR